MIFKKCTSVIYLDINECDVNKGGCKQICINKQGSHECKCEDGYELGSDSQTCAGSVTQFLDF